MADPNQVGLQGNSSDFLKVLLKLEEKTMKDLHVASLGIVTQHSNEDAIYTCRLIPTLDNEHEKSIQCYCVDDLTIEDDDLVLILFLDRNFIQNLRQIRNNQNLSNLSSQSELHSHSYGIIISKVKKSLTESQESTEE